MRPVKYWRIYSSFPVTDWLCSSRREIKEYIFVIFLLPVSGIGARELWGTLRNNSQVKLEKQDDMIPPDVKVMKTAYRSRDWSVASFSSAYCKVSKVTTAAEITDISNCTFNNKLFQERALDMRW